MDSIIIATIKSWNLIEAEKLKYKLKDSYNVEIISKKEELIYEKISKINPKYIFFPHWSWKIPNQIFNNFECIVFHMTDLPFGRGGSPLQNLISRGIENTKISAIKVVEEIDGGPIYIKKTLNLNGNAEEIFVRSSKIIFDEMIPEIIENKMKPVDQKGKVVYFKRRKKEDGNISKLSSLKQIFDYIRMLDAEGYPKAFFETENFVIEFSRASLKTDHIVADAKIYMKQGEKNEK